MAVGIDCVAEVGTTFTTVAPEVVINGYADKLSVEVFNPAGGTTTSGFRVQVQTDYFGEFVSFVGDTDFDSLANPALEFCSTTGPHELTADTSALFVLRVQMRVYAIRFQAKVAAGTTWVHVRGDVF